MVEGKIEKADTGPASKPILQHFRRLYIDLSDFSVESTLYTKTRIELPTAPGVKSRDAEDSVVKYGRE